MSSELRRLGKYELQKRLAHGGMGEVWKALDTQLQRYVAIKLLRADWQYDPDFVSRFTREAQFIASLHHPNIMQIHDFQIAYGSEEHDATAYMVMDYVQGQTLGDFIRSTSRKGAFPTAEEIVHIFTGTSLAIDYAHKRGMVHRDIKPANILLDQRPPFVHPLGKPVLIDFGIARIQGAHTGTAIGTLLGTPHYISPEQAKGQHGDHYSDLYSLGIILYEITTGITPFRGDTTMAILLQHINSDPTPPPLINPQIPQQLSETILKSIAKKPEDRFHSAAELTIAITEALHVPAPKQLRNMLASTSSHTSIPSHDPVDASLPPPLSLTPSDTQWRPPIEANSAYSPLARSDDPVTPEDSLLNAAEVFSAFGQRPTISTPGQGEIQSRALLSAQASPVQQAIHRHQRIFMLTTLLVFILLASGISAWFLLPRPHASIAPGPVGQVRFINSGHVPTGNYDEVQIDLSNIPAPPQGQVYYAWIESASSEQFRPHWRLMPHNGAMHSNSLTFQGYHNLLQPDTILLITTEDSSSDPNVPSPDLNARHYYAQLKAISQPVFSIEQCPATSSSDVCLQ